MVIHTNRWWTNWLTLLKINKVFPPLLILPTRSMLLYFTPPVYWFTDYTRIIYQFQLAKHHSRAPLAMNDFQRVFWCFSSQILLDANTIQLGGLPLGVYTASPSQASQEQAVYEVCVCPSGKIYLSPAEGSSTCQAMSNICLWSWPGSSVGDRGHL